MGTVERFRTPTVVLIANGEVHTHEEAQVFVHDLNQFVTVQLLEETPAVLSLGKLCKDHGYSYERVSGLESRLNQKWEKYCDNFVPFVVPGLSANSGSCSSFTTPPQESLGPEASLVSGNRPASSSSDSVTNWPPGDWGRKLWEVTRRTRTIRWQIFHSCHRISQTIWSPQKCMHPHTFLRTQIRNILQKWQRNQRKHSIFTHFPKDRDCDVCFRTKTTKASCRRREALPRAEKYVDLITADHKVLSEGCESRDNHRYAVVVQDLATRWIQSYPCKTKSSHETERSLLKFLEPSQKAKSSLYGQVHWNLENLVKIYHGLIEPQHLIDPRQMASLKEPSDE